MGISGKSQRHGFGLGLLPPHLRLPLVIAITSSYVYIRSLRLAFLAFLFSMFLLVMNGRVRLPRLFASVLVVTMTQRLVGNLIFSPVQGGAFWTLHINWHGLALGFLGALKGGAMLTAGYAAMSCTPIPEYVDALCFYVRRRDTQKLITAFFRCFQLFRDEVVRLRQNITIREGHRRWFDLEAHISAIGMLTWAVVSRLLANVPKITFTSETRWAVSGRGARGRVEIKALEAGYDSPVLRGIDLILDPNEFVLLAGRSGSGKTTLLRVLTNYPGINMIGPAGQILISDRDLSPMELSEVGTLVRYLSDQVSDSIIGLTVKQDILLATNNDINRAKHCLALMGIEASWDKETSALSGGQKARLALASVLASEPALLLLDGPLEQLDGIGRQEFMAALLDFRKEAKATIIVTDHFFYEFLPYITRLIVLDQGRIVGDCGSPISIQTLQRFREEFGIWQGKAEPSSLWKRVDPIAELRDVHLKIDGSGILDGVSIQVYAHEILAVTGPNGSGKSTSMLVLAGAIKPTSGAVRYPRDCPIRLVFQEADLQIVRDTVSAELRLDPESMGWDAGRISDFVERQRSWLNLSGGENPLDLPMSVTRLLACASVSAGPGMVIFDEPSVGLDGHEVGKLCSLLYSLASRGVAVVVVSHDPRLLQIASRVIVMENGKVIWQGTSLAEQISSFPLTTGLGVFPLHAFAYGRDGRVAICLAHFKNDTVSDCLVRIQFGCAFGTALGSLDCDCGLQMQAAISQVAKESYGLLIYLPQEEGTGHGLQSKLRQLSIERRIGVGPFAASQYASSKYADYGCLEYIPYILHKLGVSGPIRLLTNSPQKFGVLGGIGTQIAEVVPLEIDYGAVSDLARQELLEKQQRLGHYVSTLQQ